MSIAALEPLLPTIERLARSDLRELVAGLSHEDARRIVDLYYQTQDERIRTAARFRVAAEGAEPHALVSWVFGQMSQVEEGIRRAMDAWTDNLPEGQWLKSITGIGPVLSAGIIGTFVSDHPTVGHWWRFAGLDPTLTWDRGQKRPYSARAKVLLWKLSDSFVKSKGNPRSFYGPLYDARKAYELERDARGGNAEAAAATIASGRLRDPRTKAIYEAGHLPDGRLDLRARRWVAKLFLSHYHHVLFELRHGECPPKPYSVAIGGHADEIRPPNWTCRR